MRLLCPFRFFLFGHWVERTGGRTNERQRGKDTQSFIAAHGNYEEILENVKREDCWKIGKLKQPNAQRASMQEQLSSKGASGSSSHKTEFLNVEEVNQLQNVFQFEEKSSAEVGSGCPTV